MASRKEMWDELNLSNDEVKRLGDAMKDDKFRKLFFEYAEEISNPENRRLYEEDIRRMENERGSNVEFIHPEPGHVLKTNVDGEKKAFINISKNDKIDTPASRRETNSQGQSGLHWTIPHSFAPPREDLDKGKQKCTVFDVVFHPDTYRMGESNKRFMKMIEDTAIDGIEQRFEVKVDRQNIKHPKMKFKGTPMPTVMRSQIPGASPKKPDEDDPLKNMPYPHDDNAESPKKSNTPTKDKKAATSKSGFVEPKYTITHRSEMDLQEYRNAPDARTSTRPKELIIRIDLPLLTSAAQGNLDVFEERLIFESKHPAAYKLDIKLLYPVDEENGAAKFDKSKHCLIVTLPVLKADVPEMPFSVKPEEIENENICSTDAENKNIPEKPLIEVLSETSQENELKPGNENDIAVCSEEPLNDSPMRNKVVLSFPDFTHNQDNETVTYIFPITNVSADSVSKTFLSTSSCWVKFVSVGSGGFPITYSFLVTFPESCLLFPEECSVDVSSSNVVLLLLKDRECRFLWDRFTAGVDLNSQEEHLFVTETNIQHELNELQAEAENYKKLNAISEQLTVEVTEMNKKKLSINVKKAAAIAEEIEDEINDEMPLSADIEVVHNKSVPNLHSILKQRSISESSDDVCSLSSSSPSSLSPRDEYMQRKSVSFSERVDKTSYKQNASVTSMKTALKSKRRRARKRDERQGRQRHNSYGSESSSGAEDLEQKSVSDSECLEVVREYSPFPEKSDGDNSCVIENETTEFKGNTESAVTEQEYAGGLDGESAGVESSKLENRGNFCDTGVVNESGDFSNEDKESEGMSNSAGSNSETQAKRTEKLKNGDVKNGEVTSNDNIENDEIDSDDLGPEDDPAVIKAKNSDLDENIVSPPLSEKTDVVSVPDNDVLDDRTNVGDDGYVSSSPGIVQTTAGNSQDDLGKTETTNSEVDSCLEWSDKSKSQEASNEHKTQCAFTFTNSVIFELDID